MASVDNHTIDPVGVLEGRASEEQAVLVKRMEISLGLESTFEFVELIVGLLTDHSGFPGRSEGSICESLLSLLDGLLALEIRLSVEVLGLDVGYS